MRRWALPLLLVLLAGCGSSASVVTRAEDTSVPAAPEDRPAAESAIRRAYANWANPSIPEEQRTAANEIVTDPAVIAKGKERAQKYLPQALQTTFVVDTITFTSATTADVDFHILFGDGPSPVVPDLVPGGAILQKGSWRVTHATGCFLDAKIGDPCPPDEFLSAEDQEIGRPFADLSRADLPDDQRVAEIENGEEIRDFIIATAHRYASALGDPLVILAVRHRSGDREAEVWYTQGSVQPGIAVLDGDHWTVSRATWCQLTVNFGGDPCPS